MLWILGYWLLSLLGCSLLLSLLFIEALKDNTTITESLPPVLTESKTKLTDT